MHRKTAQGGDALVTTTRKTGAAMDLNGPGSTLMLGYETLVLTAVPDNSAYQIEIDGPTERQAVRELGGGRE